MGFGPAPGPAPEPRGDLILVVRCTYCHDDLGAKPVYCATCLAAHHDACFTEHKRCAAPGCGQVLRVRPEASAARKTTWKLAALLLLAVVAVGAARLPATPTPSKPQEAAVLPSPTGTPSAVALGGLWLSASDLPAVFVPFAPGDVLAVSRDDEGFCVAVLDDGDDVRGIIVADPGQDIRATWNEEILRVTPAPGELVLVRLVDRGLRVSRSRDPSR